MRNLFWKFLMAKLVGLLLCGQVAAQTANIIDFAHAIARAEGFGVKNSLPTRTHNPGDIRALSAHQFHGQIGVTSKRYAIFRNDAAGWTALFHQLQKVADGESRFYGRDTTIRQFSKRYAEVSGVWLKNVCAMLSISPNTTLAEYFNSNRVLVLVSDTAPADLTFDFNLFEGVLQQ